MRTALPWITAVLPVVMSLPSGISTLQQWRLRNWAQQMSPLSDMIDDVVIDTGRFALPVCSLTAAAHLLMLERHVRHGPAGGFAVGPMPALPLTGERR